MRQVADGKKLLIWGEALVLMDCSLLPEGRVSKSLSLGWEGSADCSRWPSQQSNRYTAVCPCPWHWQQRYQMVMEDSEDGLDGNVEMHHHCLWLAGTFHLPQEVHPLHGVSDERADVQCPLQILENDGSQEVVGLQCVDNGVNQCDFYSPFYIYFWIDFKWSPSNVYFALGYRTWYWIFIFFSRYWLEVPHRTACVHLRITRTTGIQYKEKKPPAHCPLLVFVFFWSQKLKYHDNTSL